MEQPSVYQQIDENTAIVTCSNCQFPVKVKPVKLERLNGGTVSMLVWTHEMYECAGCKSQIIGAFGAINPALVQFTWIANRPPSESLIEAPKGLII